jgi:glucosylglycerol-phosphate synthase
MLLATDLDGTFLAGNDEERHRLYHLVAHHPDIQLAFVTGRGLETVMPLLDDAAMPRPDYVICDVGATVVDGTSLQPIQPLQAEIESCWPGERPVVQAVSRFPMLSRQDVPQERRVSFYCEPDAVPEKLVDVVSELGCDLLYSALRYLDVLPGGVNKGSTLKRLVELLGLDPDSVLVAGDTLNDLAMYQAGFKGVCVGDSEAGLLQATQKVARVLHANRPGCGGILEAMTHFGFLGEHGIRAARSADATAAPDGRSDLVLIYHRLPYEEVVEDGKMTRRPPQSPNGIIPTLLDLFADDRRGTWLAWSVQDPKRGGPFETHVPIDPERYPNLTAARVPLSRSEVDIFYKVFSKEAFWPTLHTFWERARFRQDHWEVFCRVNRKFAEAAANEAADGATIWIHDYNLWMVPAYLRALRPDLRIAFFHHTYFPSADVFNVIPWRRDIIGSLLQCDYVGFHIPRQAENFLDVVRGAAPVRVLERRACAPRFVTYGCAVGLEQYTTAMEVNGRVVRMGAHPAGLDVNRVKASLDQPEVRKRMEELRRELKGQRVMLAVERLDYTKGTLEKLLAFEALLHEYPELHGKVSLLTICVPAAREMTVYRTLQNQIEQAVGRINGQFSRVGWTPLQFFFRALPFSELCAYYAMADVMWITPKRDGLNLVSKEYVAVQGLTKGRGVLVLSEFAGAAAELKGAVLTNPHDPEDMASAAYLALNMGRAEAEGRLRQLFEIVRHHDLARWGREFLEAVNEDSDLTRTLQPVRPSAA